MAAMAGRVVTETSTPTRVLECANVSDSTPATAATLATMALNTSGCEMNPALSWLPNSKFSGMRSIQFSSAVITNAAATAAVEPMAPTMAARAKGRPLRCWRYHDMAAMGPYSGPTTMAPTMRMLESVSTPAVAMIAATTKYACSSGVTCMPRSTTASTSAHSTVSSLSPGAWSRASCTPVPIESVECVTLIDPWSVRPRSTRSDNRSLLASRATSKITTSPAGCNAAPVSRTTLVMPVRSSRSCSVASQRSCGTRMEM